MILLFFENEVLTALGSAGKEPTESLTFYAGFPMQVGMIAHINLSKYGWHFPKPGDFCHVYKCL